ncbi:MAG TPA: hypothetical protein VNU19_05215 [Candidatus Acidoferrum sp.]|jgi:hypothetical protein|nr:hypothetical protein [Candidatus Acidoferrum sp.]
MADELTGFFAAAESEFAWLVTDYGFHEVSRDHKYGTLRLLYGSIAWATTKTFVEVNLEVPSPRLDVQFGALTGGKLPSIFDIARRYHLSGLVVVRAHDEKWAAKLEQIGGLRKRQIVRGLRDTANALRELGDDILRGDHTVFKELGALGEWQISQYRSKYLSP